MSDESTQQPTPKVWGHSGRSGRVDFAAPVVNDNHSGRFAEDRRDEARRLSAAWRILDERLQPGL